MTPLARIQRNCLITFFLFFLLPWVALLLPAEIVPAVVLIGMVGSAGSILTLIGFTVFAGGIGRKLPPFVVRTIWVEWRYAAAEWEAFMAREWSGTVWGAAAVVVAATLLIGLGVLGNGDWSDVPVFAAIGFGVGSAVGVVILARGLHTRYLRRHFPAEVDIGPYHVRLQQQITNWRTSGNRLQRVTLEAGPTRLVFHIRKPSRKSDDQLEVPVPEGQQQAAAEIVKRFAEDLSKQAE